jgi:hypothetical protein
MAAASFTNGIWNGSKDADNLMEQLVLAKRINKLHQRYLKYLHAPAPVS